MNYAQIKAIEKSNKERLIKHFGNIPDTSGIYILTRFANNKKYAYIGLSIHILTRMAQHLVGYKKKNPQHIDLSLKKHKLLSDFNIDGWNLEWVEVIEPTKEKLDNEERYYIKHYQNEGYELRNKTGGGQGKGKEQIAEYTRNGYRKGVAYGKSKLRKEIKYILDKYFDIVAKKDNKLTANARVKLDKLLEE